ITYPDGGPNTLSVTHLNSQYFNNFVNVNNVCSLTNAYAQGLGTPEVSIHWFVDPSANLYVKKIDDDHSDGNWSRYYGGSQANATLEVAKDMILYDFSKNVEEYANSIVLSSLLRKPAEDWITELNPSPGGTGGSQLWGGAGGSTGITDTAVAGEFIVGANAVKQTTNGAVTQLRYPSGQAAAWDFNNIGSENNIPTVNFYLRTNPTLLPFGSADFHAYTAVAASYYYDFALDVTVNAKWYHFSFPLGQFNTRSKQGPDFEWVVTGNPSWSNINWFEIEWDAANLDWICIDDFHMSGIIVREARDTSEITAHNLHQKVLRNDAAVDDSMKSGTPGTTDLGTAAQLAYAELLRRSQTPIVASIQIPMLPDLLPGQTLHIHACKQSNSGTCDACGGAGTFRIAQDFRVKDLQHQIIAP
ncbi:MAG: hypothetical protein GTO41_07400, partial [Burkholderiales bacterium]|nr:hypothetical protein [Burkholderiales bacterium]